MNVENDMKYNTSLWLSHITQHAELLAMEQYGDMICALWYL